MQKLIVALLLAPVLAFSQPCKLLKNIHENPAKISALEFVDKLLPVGKHLFFSGATCSESPEVFAVNAAEDSIFLPRNLRLDDLTLYCSADPIYVTNHPKLLAQLGEKVIFHLPHDVFGRELWVSDGTPDGTKLTKDIYPGNVIPNPKEVTVFDGKFWFSANDGLHGREIWFYDPAQDSTSMLADLVAGAEGSMPQRFCVFKNQLFFVLLSPTQGWQLWKTDGTASGTSFQFDLSVLGKTADIAPIWLQAAGDALFFATRHAPSATASIYKISPDGWQTTLLGNFPATFDSPNHIPSAPVFFENKWFFAANTADKGRELWQTDGTPNGTNLVADLNTLPPNYGSSPANFFVFKNVLFFIANTDLQTWRLCKLDGNGAGVEVFAQPTGVLGENFLEWEGQFWFSANGGKEIWRSDGTLAGTQLAFSGFQDIGSMTVFNQSLYFSADQTAVGKSIWKIENGSAQPKRVKGFEHETATSTPLHPIKMGNFTYFWARNAEKNLQIWRTNGVEALQVTTLPPVSPFFEPSRMVCLRDSLLVFNFPSASHPSNRHLWVTDGLQGSEKVILQSQQSNHVGWIFGGDSPFAYFTTGDRLWRTDGTATGTIDLNFDILSLIDLVFWDGSTFAQIYKGGKTWLMKTDGTPNGTSVLTQINHQQSYSSPPNLLIFNGEIYFFKSDDDKNWGLWKTDGSTAGTSLVLNFQNDSIGKPSNLVVVKDFLMFLNYNSVANNNKLWISDGTAAGTQALNEMQTAPSFSFGFSPTEQRVLYFVRWTAATGLELWRTDGTTTGTFLLKDIQPGAASSYPYLGRDWAVGLDSIFYFSAFTETHGRELWQTDGTEAGTKMVQDICPGACTADPQNLVAMGGHRLFFSAYSPESNIEPWIFDPFNLSASPAAPPKTDWQQIAVFPNPASDRFFVNLKPLAGEAISLKMLRLDGREVKNWSLDGSLDLFEIETSGLAASVYFLKIEAVGSRATTLKIVVAK